MRKVLISLIVAGLSFFCLAVPALAQEQPLYAVSFESELDNESGLKVTQILTVTNPSKTLLISSLDLQMPLSSSSLRITYNDQPLPARLDGQHLSIDLSRDPIGLEKSRVFVLDYRAAVNIELVGSVRRVVLPTVQARDGITVNEFKLTYPKKWGEISYCNRLFQNVSEDSTRKKINFTGAVNELIISFGRPNFASINASWSMRNVSKEKANLLVPVPASQAGSFELHGQNGADTGYIDENGNHFLLVALDPGQEKSGNFVGEYQFNGINLAENKALDRFYNDASELGLTAEDTVYTSYFKVLAKLNPGRTKTFAPRTGIATVLEKAEHSSLDYASTVVAALRSKNVPAEVIYGYVRFPYESEFTFSFWVVYKSGNKWLQLDPFLHDLTGFDNFSAVTPERMPWGILPDSEDGVRLSPFRMQSTNLIKFHDESVAGEGTKPEAVVILNLVDKAFSAQQLPLELEVHNSGNRPLTLASVEIENIKIDTEFLRQFWILPQTKQIIRVHNVVLHDPFFKGNSRIAGKATLTDGRNFSEFPLNIPVQFEVNESALRLNLIVAFVCFAAFSLLLKTKGGKLRKLFRKSAG